MSHKQKCIEYTIEYLAARGLEMFFCEKHFNSYYRKHKCHQGNAWKTGADIADYIIIQTNNTTLFQSKFIFQSLNF